MGRNNADFHGITFRTVDHGPTGAYIEANHPEHGLLGQLILDKNHVIDNIGVREDFRRKGVATGMVNYAKSQGFSPTHSPVRSESGEAFAKSFNEPIPERRGNLS
jgi:hypothetical protein